MKLRQPEAHWCISRWKIHQNSKPSKGKNQQIQIRTIFISTFWIKIKMTNHCSSIPSIKNQLLSTKDQILKIKHFTKLIICLTTKFKISMFVISLKTWFQQTKTRISLLWTTIQVTQPSNLSFIWSIPNNNYRSSNTNYRKLTKSWKNKY